MISPLGLLVLLSFPTLICVCITLNLRGGFYLGLLTSLALGIVPLSVVAEPQAVQDQTAGITQNEEQLRAGDDIVVTGRCVAGSVIGDTAWVAVLDADALRSLGATDLQTVLDRLRPLTEAAGGRRR